MKRVVLPLAIGLALSLSPAQAQESLYQRLGGYDGIAAFTDAFVGKLAKHPSLGRFFVGHSASSNVKIRQLIVDFVCNKSGGACFYTGRSMADAHTGLKITEQDWTDSLTVAGETMAELKMEKAVQDEVAAFVTSLKPDIVADSASREAQASAVRKASTSASLVAQEQTRRADRRPSSGPSSDWP